MKSVAAIFQKQVRETLKNKEILIQFVMFPVMAVIMENTVRIQGMPERFFTNLFAVMYIGMAPLTVMSAVIAEEKEKHTLRALFMSGVKPAEYLLAIGGYVWTVCMIGGSVFAVTGRYQGRLLGIFTLTMSLGVLTSIMIGAAIGTLSKNQMAATSVTVPVMMVFSFLPMLGMFNETIKKIADLTYSGQIYEMIWQAGQGQISTENVLVLTVNGLLAAGLFGWSVRKGVE